MNRSELIARGFDRSIPFDPWGATSGCSSLPLTPGVYGICAAGPDSEVIYIGCAANARGLRGRILQYFRPGPSQHTNHRVRNFIGSSGNAYLLFYRSAASSQQARTLEYQILTDFVHQNRRLPRLNRVVPELPNAPATSFFRDDVERDWASLLAHITCASPEWRDDITGEPEEDDYLQMLIDESEAAQAAWEDAVEQEWYAEDEDAEDEGSEVDDYDGDGAEICEDDESDS